MLMFDQHYILYRCMVLLSTRPSKGATKYGPGQYSNLNTPIKIVPIFFEHLKHTFFFFFGICVELASYLVFTSVNRSAFLLLFYEKTKFDGWNIDN
jgi:hypothetical protein